MIGEGWPSGHPLRPMANSHVHFPEPDEIWKDCIIKDWSFEDNGLFITELTGISSRLPYCDQSILTRVVDYVADVISRAQKGQVSVKEAVELVKFRRVFTKEELEVIEENTRKYGATVGKFYRNKGESN